MSDRTDAHVPPAGPRIEVVDSLREADRLAAAAGSRLPKPPFRTPAPAEPAALESPTVVPVPPQAVVTFFEACHRIVDRPGAKATRQEWDDAQCFMYLKDGYLMLRYGGSDWTFKLREVDLRATDWVVFG